jgi:Rrf2 family protein
MLSNSCRYGIRAVIYLARNQNKTEKTGIKKISEDLELPSPFLAKILQQLAKHRILSSSKGPHGGFSLLKNPENITLLDVVNIIDGEEVFTQCVMHNGDCISIDRNKKPCPIHDDYSKVRTDIIGLFRNKTIADLAKTVNGAGGINI